ncbi:LysE family transporter [Amycolatopsis sp. NPDC005232]|uniref:LysE family translocator n=1 Tax=Amycolatopsis sp. NPDC005232 TaxID=3157027 RepID=UPI0033A672E1
MAIGGIFAFWGVSFLLVLTPGADWAYLINAGLRKRSIPLAVGGLLVGYLALTAVVAAGVAALVAGSPVVLTVLTAVGAVYLIWLGVSALLRPATPGSATDSEAGSWVRQVAKGAGISGLNPKALLLFLALLPQFTDPWATWPVAGQILVLGLVHTLSCGLVYAGVGLGARVVLSTRPGWARGVSRFSGGAMIAIGTTLLVQQLAA